jgi:site-specific DNA-methyltransferase (cytosine-N4-specific)
LQGRFNIWFSDIWDVKGVRQSKDDGGRTGAFPLEIPFRLICMYSCLGDVILDPFGGTGTTALAALAAGRSSISVEIDEALVRRMPSRLVEGRAAAAERTNRRISEHLEFLEARKGKGKEALKHRSQAYGMPVVTAQERLLEFVIPNEVRTAADGCVQATHGKAELKSLPSI